MQAGKCQYRWSRPSQQLNITCNAEMQRVSNDFLGENTVLLSARSRSSAWYKVVTWLEPRQCHSCRPIDHYTYHAAMTLCMRLKTRQLNAKFGPTSKASPHAYYACSLTAVGVPYHNRIAMVHLPKALQHSMAAW